MRFPRRRTSDLLGRLDVAHDDRPVTVFDVFVVQRCQQRELTPATGQHGGLSTREHTIAKELLLPYTTVYRWLGEKKEGYSGQGYVMSEKAIYHQSCAIRRFHTRYRA